MYAYVRFRATIPIRLAAKSLVAVNSLLTDEGSGIIAPHSAVRYFSVVVCNNYHTRLIKLGRYLDFVRSPRQLSLEGVKLCQLCEVREGELENYHE